VKLEAFLNLDSLAAMAQAQANPAPPPRPPRVAVLLYIPTVEPVMGDPCPVCKYALELRLVPWPPRAKPKKGPWEAWWCSVCFDYYVYEEKRDGSEKGGGKAPVPPVQRANNGNGGVLPMREGGVPGTVPKGGEKRAV